MAGADMVGANSVEKLEDVIVRSAEQVAGQIRAAKEAISTVIFGQEKVVENTLVTILSGGHALLIGVPGLAKTKLVETLGITLGLDAKRVQFTPDLMPSDILGAEVLDESSAGKRSFRFISGPVFAQLLMADEINRASPRTQAALLEAMGEGMVTMDRTSYRLERPFMVMATQNPIDQEGTFRLPEAQMDRFLIRLSLGYPSATQEKEMCLRVQQQHPLETLKPVTTADEILKCQRGVRHIPLGPDICDYLVGLTRATREHPALRLGASPRGSLGLFHTAQALAAIQGSASVSIEHIKAIAVPVLAHRLLVRNETSKDYPDGAAVIQEILAKT